LSLQGRFFAFIQIKQTAVIYIPIRGATCAAEIKTALPAFQKADRAMDDPLLPASQMWKNSCRIMYQVILLSNCYQNEEKTPQTLDISRRLGQCYVMGQGCLSCLGQNS